MTRRDLVVRVVAAVTLTAVAVLLGDSDSRGWALLGLLAALAGTNLGPSLADNTGKLLTAGWWSRSNRLTMVSAFSAGLACSAGLVGSTVWILGELQEALRTLDRIVFGFILVLAMLFIDYDRHKRRDLAPWVNRRTEQDLEQPRSASGAFSLGAQLGAGSQAFKHSVAPHVVLVVAVLTNPGLVDSIVVCGVFGLSRLTPVLVPRLADLSRPARIANTQFLAIPAMTLLIAVSLIEPFPLATVDQSQISATPQAQISWTARDIDRGIAARSDYSLTVFDKYALIWGGVTDDGLSSTGVVLNATGKLTHAVGEAPIAGRRHHTAVWTGTEMIVWGGTSQFGLERHADGAAYNPMTDQWRVIAPSPLDAVWDHTAVWTGTEMIVWGGTSGSDQPSGLGAAYNPTTDAWRYIHAAKISARSGHSATWTGSEMVIWGGRTDKAVDDGAAYNPTTNKWRELPEGPLKGAQDALVTWTGTDVLVAGGSAGDGPRSDAALWNPRTNLWRRLPPTPVPSLEADNAAWVGEVLVAVTGDATIIFDTRTLLWSSAPPPETEAVDGYSLQGVDGVLVLFGGYSLNRDAGPFHNDFWTAEVNFPSTS